MTSAQFDYDDLDDAIEEARRSLRETSRDLASRFQRLRVREPEWCPFEQLLEADIARDPGHQREEDVRNLLTGIVALKNAVDRAMIVALRRYPTAAPWDMLPRNKGREMARCREAIQALDAPDAIKALMRAPFNALNGRWEGSTREVRDGLKGMFVALKTMEASLDAALRREEQRLEDILDQKDMALRVEADAELCEP